jgi:AcrR family transcriptional regulator
MSKSGLYAHFGSKEELQLATVEKAWAIYNDVVIVPALAVKEPLTRLETLCEGFLDHPRNNVFPGGCFFSSAGAELAPKPGPVRSLVLEKQMSWMQLLIEALFEARTANQLKPDIDPYQFAFELDSFLLMGNFSFLMAEDTAMLDRADLAFKTHLANARA